MKATIKMVNQILSGVEVVFEYDAGDGQIRQRVLSFPDSIKAAEVKAAIRAFLETKAVAPKVKQLRDALVGDVVEL